MKSLNKYDDYFVQAFCMKLYELRFEDCRRRLPKSSYIILISDSISGADFISVWGEFKMSMANLSAKLGDLHRSFKLNIEIPKYQIDTLE